MHLFTINAITAQQLITQEGCQKGIRASNAGHP